MSTSTTPAPESTCAEWDQEVRKCTDDFMVDGSTIKITIAAGDKPKVFRVSRALLSHWSSTFRVMFEDASADSDTVEIHNDPNDFADFLWFIHVDPISFQKYISSCPKEERFRRALGVASIAHFYEATEITLWATKELLEHLHAGSTPEFLPKLHRLGELCQDINPNLAQKTREAWVSMISSSPDPVAALGAAKSIQDQYLQAYAYYHVLKKTSGQIADDTRLDELDRLRLIIGSLNLRRYEVPACNCSDRNVKYDGYNRHYGYRQHTHEPLQATTDERLWTPQTSAPLQDKYDTHTLWDLFTRSPLGIQLSDGFDGSRFALPSRKKGKKAKQNHLNGSF